MSNNIENVGEDIKKHFEQIGTEIKQELINDFNNVLANDLNEVKKSLTDFVRNQNRRSLESSRVKLQNAIGQEFKGNIFAEILGNAILPTIVNGINSGGFSSGDFRAAAGQTLLELGQSIARSQQRNG